MLSRGKKFIKHRGLRDSVHLHLVHTGDLAGEWGKVFDRLFENRHLADYEALMRFDADRATKLLQQAEGFVQQMERLITTKEP